MSDTKELTYSDLRRRAPVRLSFSPNASASPPMSPLPHLAPSRSACPREQHTRLAFHERQQERVEMGRCGYQLRPARDCAGRV
ncbi:hypothetical protein KC365_g105 [Hortaea werneckii]|nr:hypothetical protein KC339_g99 [Hortaea werneckii]KAI7245874.1 hypothetical protein KC365_g105 [Hortaea werneckii]